MGYCMGHSRTTMFGQMDDSLVAGILKSAVIASELLWICVKTFDYDNRKEFPYQFLGIVDKERWIQLDQVFFHGMLHVAACILYCIFL